jgi:hypothetical protein
VGASLLASTSPAAGTVLAAVDGPRTSTACCGGNRDLPRQLYAAADGNRSRQTPDQPSTSRGEVMRTHVQPVSLHTRLSAVPGSARL